MKLSLKKTYAFLKKCYLYFIFLLFIALIASNIYIYYTYIYLLTGDDIEAVNEEITIDQDNLGIILDSINERENNLKRIQNSNYRDPFN